jgi:hypothetical protein
VSADDRQLLELTSQEEWERKYSPAALLPKMLRDVERGNALRKILDAERRAAIPDEHELEHEHERRHQLAIL